MYTQSIWNDTTSLYNFPALTNDITADVAIIGGGITGISTARLLVEQGFSVVVLESLKVGAGATGHSTGNLYVTTDKNLAQLSSKHNEDVMTKVVSSRQAALNRIESWVNQLGLDCDFGRQNWNLYSATAENDERIAKELEFAQKAGLGMRKGVDSDFPLKTSSGITLPDQAQLNPLRYVQQLATAPIEGKLSIFECTRVQDLEETEDGVILTTTGGRVHADYAVMATHTPKGFDLLQTLLGPYREYGIACKADNIDFPPGIFWGYHNGDQKISFRLYKRNAEKFVLVVGEPHKVGQTEDNRKHIQLLEDFAREHFGLTDVAYRWGGQHYRPADLLPYIGRRHSKGRTFVATGFSTDGLVYGTLAAMLIADEIAGKENPYQEMYNPRRFTPVKSAKSFLSENINVAATILKDLPGGADEDAFADIKPGEGAVIISKGKKIAAFRTEENELHLNSAICPHLKCTVNWNNAEKTWDCPCHGSRFSRDGNVLEGPAWGNLSRITFTGNESKINGLDT